jgi:hypothetical protein
MRDHELAYLGAVGNWLGPVHADARFHAFLRRLRLPLPPDAGAPGRASRTDDC